MTTPVQQRPESDAPLDNRPAASKSLPELRAYLEWLEQYPAQWWSNAVGYTEQRKRDYLNERRKELIVVYEEEIATRSKQQKGQHGNKTY